MLVGGLVLCGWLSAHLVSPLAARQDAAAPAAPAQSAQERELNTRLAQAHLKLMEARLAEFEDRNRRAPNTIRPAGLQLVQEYVAKARLRVELAQSDAADDSQVYVSMAQTELRLAEDSLKRAEAVNKRLANTVSPREIARLGAQRDLAKIKVEKAQHLSSESSLSNLRFEIDQLREELQELRLLEVTGRRGS
jgi:hypothetical protein